MMPCVEQRAADGEHHADFAGEEAAARGDRRAQPLERENEESGGDEVSEFDERFGGEKVVISPSRRSLMACSGPLDLNILSMRSVMMKPPTMLLVAAMMAMRAENGGEIGFVFAGQDDGADDGDGVERVGEGHQRSVQQRRDAADDFKADECGQHENVKAGEQVQLHCGVSSSDSSGTARAGIGKIRVGAG